MKILGISHPNSGCGYHRVCLPMGYMDKIEGVISNYPTEEMLSIDYDILLFNRLSIWDNNLNAIREAINCKIVCDMDDDWILPSNHLNYRDYQQLTPRIENNILEADLVTCTNERLAERIYPINKNVQIFPNALPFYEGQFLPDKKESELIRIFWAGGCTHEHDLQLLQFPLQRLVGNKKIKMVLGGYTDDDASRPIWNKMLNYFTANKRIPFEAYASMRPTEYFEMFENADIMLVPLVANNWSRCKSNLKLIEASVKSIPVICSKVEPYSMDADAPVLWVEKQSDWYKHLNFLINNEKARQDYGQALNEWGKSKFNLFEINPKRRESFENIIKA
jgi:hypothetical protein